MADQDIARNGLLRSYCVVELDSGGVFTAASKWIQDGVLYYPKKVKNQNPQRMTLQLFDLPATISMEKWLKYDAGEFKVLYDYDKYMVAEKAVKQAVKGKSTLDSNVDTDLDKSRLKRKPDRFRESSSNSGSEVDSPPPKNPKRKRRQIESDTESDGHKGEDEDEIERLVKQQRVDKSNKIGSKKNKPKSPAVSPSSEALRRQRDRPCDYVGSGPETQAVKKNLFPNEVVCTSKQSPFKVTETSLFDASGSGMTSPLKHHRSPLKSTGAGIAGSSPTSRVFSRSSQDGHLNQPRAEASGKCVSSYISGYKANKVFTFGDSRSFEEAAPALMHVLSAIINSLHELHSQLDFIAVDVDAVKCKICPEEEQVKRPDGMPPLNMKTFEQFEQLDKFVKDGKNRKALIAILHSKMRHAETMRAAAKAAMKKLFAPEGARLVSWCGTGGLKFPFSDTNLCLAVEAALVKKFPNEKLAAGIAAIKKWFNTSFQRVVPQPQLAVSPSEAASNS